VCDFGRLEPAVDVELAQDVRDMGARCFHADRELRGDLAVRVAAGQQLEHFVLSRRQAQRVPVVRQRARVDAREIETRTPSKLLELVYECRRAKPSAT
jgi:hypothetical protein